MRSTKLVNAACTRSTCYDYTNKTNQSKLSPLKLAMRVAFSRSKIMNRCKKLGILLRLLTIRAPNSSLIIKSDFPAIKRKIVKLRQSSSLIIFLTYVLEY